MPLKSIIITFCTSVVESVHFNHLNYNNKVLTHLLQIIDTLGHMVSPWFQAASGFQYENQLADTYRSLHGMCPADSFTSTVSWFRTKAYSDTVMSSYTRPQTLEQSPCRSENVHLTTFKT